MAEPLGSEQDCWGRVHRETDRTEQRGEKEGRGEVRQKSFEGM